MPGSPHPIGQTERFYDLTGGMTYLVVVSFSLWAGSDVEEIGSREFLISALVAIWCVRLSGFLFLRIHHKGKDGRFDDLKTSPVRFLVPWTLQGLWIFLTANVVIVDQQSIWSLATSGVMGRDRAWNVDSRFLDRGARRLAEDKVQL